MKRFVPIVTFMLMTLTPGCAIHYQELREDRVVFYLRQPDAHQVILSCSLDGFDFHKAVRVGDLWMVSLPLDDPFRYFYVIDGKRFLPPCQIKENDDFGSKNCIYDPQL